MDEPLIDLSLVNPRIILDIKYATSDNFVGKPVYTLAKAYLRESVAEKLNRVQEGLERNGLGLKVWDAYRPLPVQQTFWDMVPDERYVADPQKGSVHNRGAAVDLTLIDADGNELAMPTGFDDFTQKAHHGYKELSDEVIFHRDLLLTAMVAQGFTPFATEWWHYNDANVDSYSLLSTTFEELASSS